MTKVTIQASSDIALIKYWGKKDEVLRLPENGSISMIVEGLHTTTTVEFQEHLEKDEITIEGESDEKEVQRVVKHLDRIRQHAGISTCAKVVSKNSFPRGTGLSSSSSAFAALTVAGSRAAGLRLSQKEESILARQGSGSACRCVCGGFVEWKDGNTSEESYAETLFPASAWDLRDLVVVVDEGRKKVSSTEGHQSAQTSPFFSSRLQHMSEKIKNIKKILSEKDFQKLGTLIEAEALEFHSILLTSTPPLIAWYPGTVEVMHEVQKMRSEGIEAYFTINTGFNVHVITLPEYQKSVKEKLAALPLVKKIIETEVGEGPVELTEHLF